MDDPPPLLVRPKRSHSDFAPPASDRKHHHHRHHYSVHHSPHASRRTAARDAREGRDGPRLLDPLSAVSDLSRQLSRSDYSPAVSADVSRRGSGVGVGLGVGLDGAEERGDAEGERGRNESRDEELRRRLAALQDSAMSTTRQLDNVYYSILEKMSALQSTIEGLKELSTATHELQVGFEAEAEELRREVEGQIEGVGRFGRQRDMVEKLEERVRGSRSKGDGLGERVVKVRARVAALQAREAEWQATFSRRLRIFWVVLVAVLLLVGAVMYPTSKTAPSQTKWLDGREASSAVPPEVQEAIMGLDRKSKTSPKEDISPTHEAATQNDLRLRRLDEL
ncbi:hypothetical protein EJ06DRAFT_579896 [Trichodelitschia bisporula]|uniref:Uncharacterized protein n=1 Tax=Trichodelitschia bisporula TaxID=703511 RepID=A0A6G1I735_9PEZI|nr:hypothetical protein EJ06DRAFT_579896 [Trichodelitschia bisporula]